MRSSTRWSLLVAGESLLVLFLLRFGTTLFADAVQHPIQLAILGSLGGLGWFMVLWRPYLLPTLLIVAPLPILFSVAITSITSPYPSLSGWATWQSAAYVGIAWLVAMQANHPVGRRNLIAVMGIVVSIVAGYFLVSVLVAWAEWVRLGFPLASVPLRPNYSGGWVFISAWLADVIVLTAPVVVVSLWLRNARLASIALLTVASIAIVLSGTRSVQLLIVGVAIVAFPILIANHGDRRTKLIAAVATGTVAIVGFSVVTFAGRAFDEGRSLLIASAFDRFVSSPLVGTGPGTYGVERMSRPVDSLVNLAQPDALNVVFTTASDSGIVGLLGLGLSVILYCVATRHAWQAKPEGRPVILAAAFGVIVFAGHSLGEFVFGLIGTLLLLIAAISLGGTDGGPHELTRKPREAWLTAILLVGIVATSVSTVSVVRNEVARAAITTAETLGDAASEAALHAARRATETSPDSVPAWWVRMVAEDSAGEIRDSIASARRIVDLEGFGQEWLSLGVLLARAGDATGARGAIDRSISFDIVDPVVELNAVAFYYAVGATVEARTAAERLLLAQPDIEPVLARTPPGVAAVAASARADAANRAIASGDMSRAMTIALYGEDRGLADSLLATDLGQDHGLDASWRRIVAAWFGDEAARTGHDADSLQHPSSFGLSWSWRLAARACDRSGLDRWERAHEILARFPLTLPNSIGITPRFQVSSLPARYPQIVWGIDHPQRPYVSGIWTYALGESPCGQQ